MYEDVRARYRPERITTLFVGESPPYKGGFFYSGRCNLLYRFRETIGFEGTAEQFLAQFRAQGWFLDDLCLEPVDDPDEKKDRKRKWREAQAGLADRIRTYQPLAIVVFVMGIAPIVREAVRSSGCTAKVYTLPFPGRYHAGRFQQEMADILPILPVAEGELGPTLVQAAAR